MKLIFSSSSEEDDEIVIANDKMIVYETRHATLYVFCALINDSDRIPPVVPAVLYSIVADHHKSIV